MISYLLHTKVNGHLDYSDKMDVLLTHLGLETREKQTSSYLSDLLDIKERESQAKRAAAEREVGDEIIRIDASDLLIPKSASAVDLALAKQEEAQAKAAENHQGVRLTPLHTKQCAVAV